MLAVPQPVVELERQWVNDFPVQTVPVRDVVNFWWQFSSQIVTVVLGVYRIVMLT
jgi:hypothetical protein